jgi:outer membrane receptor for ferrienterochelin and colicins
MWRRLVPLITAGLTCGVVLTAQAGVQGPSATLVVTVRTAAGTPIADAEVRVGDGRVYTDRAGEAVIVVPAGTIAVEASAAGYGDSVTPITAAPGASTLVAITLAPAAEAALEFDEAVIVTATRSSTRLQDQALRVEVIDREEIEEKALMTPGSVAMLLGETTGLRVQTTAPSLGAANVRIQGLRGRYAQLLSDGLPLYGAQGNSLSLLQVPPLDLDQVEVIKGAASALYGPAALGGVINLVSRRPRAPEREGLLNVTSHGGVDTTIWLAETPGSRWGWTLLGGYHAQSRRDLDADGWSDVSGFQRVVLRPRAHYDDGQGRRWFATGGVMAEDREGGTLDGGLAPDGRPFAERLDSRHVDLGTAATWITAGGRLVAARGSFMRLAQARQFGEARERGARQTWFGEASIAGAGGPHSWVIGGALQQDRYRARDLQRFDYTHTVPAIFAQDEVVVAPWLSLSASARVDAHSEYGPLISPRVSLLAKPAARWTVRVSSGLGAFRADALHRGNR